MPSSQLSSLLLELLQAELAASKTPLAEARRLGNVPPAWAMRALSYHADGSVPQVLRLAEDRGLALPSKTLVARKLASLVRAGLSERLWTSERSYRMTLLELRHEADVVRVLRSVAEKEDDRGLEAWCGAWLSKREALIDEAAERLAWFGGYVPDERGEASGTLWAKALRLLSPTVNRAA